MISYKNIELKRIDNQQKGKAKYKIGEEEYFAEEAVIKNYENLGYKAIWTENTYWWMLMSLLFWDVIFVKIRGAVSIIINGVQTELDPATEGFEELFNQAINMNGMPADFFTTEFYERRKGLIKNKIQELQHSDLEQKISESYKNNYGKICRPIDNWDRYKIEELLIPVKKIDKDKLIKIINRLISNFNDNRAGLPDLIVYNDKDFFFSEVKSEKDKISEKQKEWHSFLTASLGFKVEITLINHSETKVEKIKKINDPTSKQAIISFGFSSSKKREEAIEYAQEQESYFTKGDGKEAIYGAKFEINDIEKLYTILDLTSGWKTQKIEIDGEVIKSTELRNSLWCFREKVKTNASLDYCKKREYDNKPIKLGCKSIYFNELENEDWQDYGYVNTTKGEWIFDHKRISEKVEEEINRLKYCPILDTTKIRKLIKKIPEKINPKIDKNWAFVSNDHNYWFWHENKWLNSFGNTNFPGFNVMVGIRKLSRKEMNQAISFSKGDYSTKISYSGSSKKAKQKPGCFIATAVYGNSEVYQVWVLKHFRDKHLEKNIFGKLFVNAYYKVSPSIAEFIGLHHFLASSVRRILNIVVKIIEKV